MSEIETVKVTLTLTKPVYEIARLICKFEYNDDFDHYVSELVAQDALNISRSGDCGIFQEYARRMLQGEDDKGNNGHGPT
ncbi:MAG: hypothetical protein ACE5SW_11685 [Nitrososphaeraceae archaeon]